MIEIVPVNESKVQRVWNKLGHDIASMEKRGVSLRERNEYVFEFLHSMEKKVLRESRLLSEEEVTQAGGGFDMFRGVKEMLAEKILSSLGVKPGAMHDIIKNTLAGLTAADIQTMFNPGGCKTIVAKLGAGIQTTAFDLLIKQLGLEPNHFIAVAILGAFKSSFAESGPFVAQASKVICSLDISKIVGDAGGMVGGLASSAAGALGSVFGKSSAPAAGAAKAPATAPAAPKK
jgi:hypothetical protein